MSRRRRRRVLYYLGAFVVVTICYTVAYSLLMAIFQGETRSITKSLLVVVETFTTTGYGEDAALWTTPVLRVFMVTMQFTGVFFIFMALPLFVAPWIEEQLSTTVPTSVEDLSGHVVIAAFTPRTRMLIDELDVLGLPYVVVEPDRERAVDIYESDHRVIVGDPENAEALQNAALSQARALVVDIDDETNASVVLTADQVAADADVQLISFVEDSEMASYHRYAGADHVFSPRQLIGESLAHKVTTGVTSEVADAIELADDFEIVELPVQAGSELAGVRVADSGIRERTGANIIGGWFRGEFASPPSPEAYIDDRTVLLVAGREAQLEGLKELTLSETRRRRYGDVVICGHGEVGSTVKQIVSSEGLPCTTIDIEDKPGVDVIGDVTNADTLREADVESANSVIVALSDDTLAIFATLVLTELAPGVEVIVRANEEKNVQKLYRAGADYVLALATVSGRMLASTILEEEVISFDQSVEIVRVDVSALAGQTLAGADIRARTNCTVIAIERDGQFVTDFDPSFTLLAGDEAIVAGPDAGINDFTALLNR